MNKFQKVSAIANKNASQAQEELQNIKKIIYGLSLLQPEQDIPITYQVPQELQPNEILSSFTKMIESHIKFYLQTPIVTLQNKIISVDTQLENFEIKLRQNEKYMNHLKIQVENRVNNEDFEEMQKRFQDIRMRMEKMTSREDFDKLLMRVSNQVEQVSQKVDQGALQKKLNEFQELINQKFSLNDNNILLNINELSKKQETFEESLFKQNENINMVSKSLQYHQIRFNENIFSTGLELADKLDINKFKEFQLSTEQYSKILDFNEFKSMMTERVNKIFKELQLLHLSQENLNKELNQMDYNLLSKANKMDQELMNDRLQKTNLRFSEMDWKVHELNTQYDSAAKLIQTKVLELLSKSQEEIKQNIQDMNHQQIQVYFQQTLSSYGLDRVIGNHERILLQLNKKADLTALEQFASSKISVRTFDNLREVSFSILKAVKVILISNLQLITIIQSKKPDLSNVMFILENQLEKMKRVPQDINRSNSQIKILDEQKKISITNLSRQKSVRAKSQQNWQSIGSMNFNTRKTFNSTLYLNTEMDQL